MLRCTAGRITVIDLWNECLPFLEVTGSLFTSIGLLALGNVHIYVSSRYYNDNISENFTTTNLSLSFLFKVH